MFNVTLYIYNHVSRRAFHYYLKRFIMNMPFKAIHVSDTINGRAEWSLDATQTKQISLY